MYFLLSTLASVAYISLARGAELTSRALSGEATFYGGNLHGGACSFSTYTLPAGVFGTALSDSNWDNAGNCGACVSVTGPGGNSLIAMIVDECPGCGLNHLDLFPDAFKELADPVKGVIPVSWDFVDCPVSGPLQLHNKDGVSQYWFSMQVVNAKRAVSSLEVSIDGGSTWHGTTRQSYNFFEYSSGFGTATVDVKVTSVDGDVVVVQNVEVSSSSSTTASSNFGSSNAAASSAAASSVESASPTTTSEVAVNSPTDSGAMSSSTSTDDTGIGGNFYQSTMSATDATSQADNYVTYSTSTTSPLADSMTLTYPTDSASATSTYTTPSMTTPAVSTVTITVPCSTSATSTIAPPPAPTTIMTTASANATIVVPSLTATPAPFTGGASRAYGSVGVAAAMIVMAMLL